MVARRFLALVTLFLTLALAPACLWAGPYEDGLAAFKTGDYPAALRPFRLAAEQGNADAQFSLGALYRLGQGVPRDYVKAHLWFNLAAAQGFEGAAKARDAAAEHMTSAQIAEAQRLAREWRPKQAAAPAIDGRRGG
jgi:TPR repeat protein